MKTFIIIIITKFLLINMVIVIPKTVNVILSAVVSYVNSYLAGHTKQNIHIIQVQDHDERM